MFFSRQNLLWKLLNNYDYCAEYFEDLLSF
ncbi:hypothetical protein PHAMO_330006 [Magnetospirillum molischianum DSM 120]|uniref:Uncharacterized protein n=1 Tax=Magnetospirillum molischianum DSM 120 TaxID=1150626 RepID=H8FUS9_MAGML|nr:hypothetical protein PHAMO_330006 [Magnetospirillum molischianum DSM 120]